MKKLLQQLKILQPQKVVLDKDEKKELASLSSKRFTELSNEERHRLLEIGAKDFSKKFSGVIEELSRE